MKGKLAGCSVIGKGSIFEGSFYVEGDLQIDGTFEGELKTKGALAVGPSGKVKTNLHAKDVLVEGIVIGNIHADRFAKLESSGEVFGNIVAPIIELAKGVIAKGKINITGASKLKRTEKK